MTTEDMLRAVLQVQHASTLQTASRMERLEDALLELSLKPEPSTVRLLSPRVGSTFNDSKHRTAPCTTAPFKASSPSS
ncbi:hypothetical protein H4Q26_001597, partial [Puccinia striiformis f. sp. tritici PST-130]